MGRRNCECCVPGVWCATHWVKCALEKESTQTYLHEYFVFSTRVRVMFDLDSDIFAALASLESYMTQSQLVHLSFLLSFCTRLLSGKGRVIRRLLCWPRLP